MKTFKTVTVTAAKQLLGEADTVILDCRKLKDYQEGHIGGAMHLHDQLRDSLLKKADKQKPILIYCYHGHSSEHLAEMFGDFGFRQVYSLAGGYTEWLQQQT
jgi:thiosulfate sulfurtransferase